MIVPFDSLYGSVFLMYRRIYADETSESPVMQMTRPYTGNREPYACTIPMIIVHKAAWTCSGVSSPRKLNAEIRMLRTLFI